MKLYGRTFNIRTYEDAETYLGGRKKAKVVNNTFVIRRDADTIALRYYNTDVITYTADGSVILSTGGWRTVTTKERLNLFSPYGIYVKNGSWYVSSYQGKGVHKNLGKFIEGMRLPAYTNAGAADVHKEYNAVKGIVL